MAGGIEINSNTGRIKETFARYVQNNRRNRETLFIDQARKYANDLYNETAAIAPTPAEIAAQVKILGWHIPTRFADGRLARGVAKNWLGLAFTKNRRRVRKRGRRSKADHLDEAEFMAQKPTLSQMQQFVIGLRVKARLFLASGWLGAIVDLGGSTKATSGFVQRDRGGAFITRAQGLLAVTFWNRSPGIADVDAKKGFVAKATAFRVADMWKYILRKEREDLQQLKQAA